jgi:hypothetical protein
MPTRFATWVDGLSEGAVRCRDDTNINPPRCPARDERQPALGVPRGHDDRDQEVLRLWLARVPKKRIAAMLCVDPKTVLRNIAQGKP